MDTTAVPAGRVIVRLEQLCKVIKCDIGRVADFQDILSRAGLG